MFVNENVNPKNKKVGDCVIRAIAKAEGTTWLETYDTLSELARSEFSVLNDKTIYGKYLNDKYEKINVKHTVKGVVKRYTVEGVAKVFKKGTYIVSVAGHLTVVINGKYYDTWDCGESCSYIIWKVK